MAGMQVVAADAESRGALLVECRPPRSAAHGKLRRHAISELSRPGDAMAGTTRRKIPASRRRTMLRRSGYACSVCATPLAGFDIHHLQYVSLGGSDEEQNLAVLCPNCHRNFAHGLYASADGRHSLAEGAHRWLQLVAVTRQVLDISRDPIRTAELLCSDEAKASVIAAGAYDLLNATIDVGLSRLSGRRDSAAAAARLNLITNRCAMSYYVKQNVQASAERLQAALKQAGKSDDLALVRNEARLALSRLHMTQRRHDDERRVLDTFEQDAASSYQNNDFSFRLMSLERYSGSSFSELDRLPKPQESDAAPAQMLLASVKGELGKAATQEDAAVAVQQLTTAFQHSHRVVHRRGIVMTALRLADVHIRAGDADTALHWWTVASAGGRVGVLPELGLQHVQMKMHLAFGAHFLDRSTSTRASVKRLLVPSNSGDAQ